MFMRDPEVIRTALVASAMEQARTKGFARTLRSLLNQQMQLMSDDELLIVAREMLS